MTFRTGAWDEYQGFGHEGEYLLSLTVQKRTKRNLASFISLPLITRESSRF